MENTESQSEPESHIQIPQTQSPSEAHRYPSIENTEPESESEPEPESYIQIPRSRSPSEAQSIFEHRSEDNSAKYNLNFDQGVVEIPETQSPSPRRCSAPSSSQEISSRNTESKLRSISPKKRKIPNTKFSISKKLKVNETGYGFDETGYGSNETGYGSDETGYGSDDSLYRAEFDYESDNGQDILDAKWVLLRQVIRRRLRSVVIRSENPISCGGELKMHKPLTLFYRGKNGSNTCNFPGNLGDVEELASACQETSFGENIIDRNYRKALKLDVENFGINFSLELGGIMNIIEKTLLGPDSERHIRAELYRLNIYPEGGFLKSHRDIARGESMIGSLVVGLPSAHESGALVVRRKGVSMRHEFSNNGRENILRWAAFSFDTRHKVEKVTKGHRVTLTYSLYTVENTGMVSPDLKTEKTNLYQELRGNIRDRSFHPHGVYLGFGLGGDYPDPLCEGNANFVGPYLRSRDKLLWDVAKQLGLEAKLKIFLSVDDDGQSFTVLTDCLKEPFIYPIHVGELRDGFEGLSGYEIDPDIEWIVPLKSSPFNFRKYSYFSYDERILNTGYGKVCLIMKIPGWSDRRNLGI